MSGPLPLHTALVPPWFCDASLELMLSAYLELTHSRRFSIMISTSIDFFKM